MTSDSFRQTLERALGGPWPEKCDIQPQAHGAPVEQDGCSIHTVSYEVEPGEWVRAFLLLPDGVDAARPAPAVCVWHQHAGQWHLGKSEPAGLDGDPMHHTGVALAREGYVVLCPDALGFEERQDPAGKLSGRDYERFLFLRYVVEGKCLAWKNILDMKRAVDYLLARPEVDPNRIGCYGHSMGSTHTWLVGPWEPRLRCLVANCCLPTYAGIHRERLLHCFPNFVPGIYPSADTPDIAALIAPRPLHMNFGELDGGSPIGDVRRGIDVIAQAYAEAGAAAMFSAYIEEGTGHVLSPRMWDLAKAWFDKHLA